MKKIVEVPEEVEVRLNKEILVKGPEGEVKRKLHHPLVKIKKEGKKIKIESERDRRKEKRLVNTFQSRIENMIKGVRKPYEYKLKVCYKHFPISVEVRGKKVLIKNFLHEKKPRVAKIVGNSEVEVKDDTIFVRGIDKEKTGQTAANIEQATQVKGRDRRVIGDGIYIVKKPEE